MAVTAVVGYSSGAADAACSNITPGHYGISPATGPVPFKVNIRSLDSGYIPGQTYTSEYIIIHLWNLCSVTLCDSLYSHLFYSTVVLPGSDSNSDFKGFLIQGRMMADNSPVGTFVDNGNNQQIKCSVSIKCALTHNCV